MLNKKLPVELVDVVIENFDCPLSLDEAKLNRDELIEQMNDKIKISEAVGPFSAFRIYKKSV